jgi:opacity protein-like surface antigen
MSSIKLALASVAAALAMGTSVMAADLVMEEVAVDDVMTENWTGFYVGGQVLGTAFQGPFPSNSVDLGVVVGANVQLDQVVLGAEGRVAYYIDDTFPPGFVAGASVRAGYLVSEDVLLYGSAGYDRFSPGALYSNLGLGVEFNVTESLSVDLEAKRWWQVFGPYTANTLSASLNWHL